MKREPIAIIGTIVTAVLGFMPQIVEALTELGVAEPMINLGGVALGILATALGRWSVYSPKTHKKLIQQALARSPD